MEPITIVSFTIQGDEKKSPAILTSHIVSPSFLLIAKMLLSPKFFPLTQPLNVPPINRESVINGDEIKGPKFVFHLITLSKMFKENILPVTVATYKLPLSKTGEEMVGPTSVTHRRDGFAIGLELETPVLWGFPLNIGQECTSRLKFLISYLFC